MQCGDGGGGEGVGAGADPGVTWWQRCWLNHSGPVSSSESMQPTDLQYTVTQDKDNFSRAEIGLFLPLWFTFYDTFPVVSFFLLNVVLIYPKLSL